MPPRLSLCTTLHLRSILFLVSSLPPRLDFFTSSRLTAPLERVVTQFISSLHCALWRGVTCFILFRHTVRLYLFSLSPSLWHLAPSSGAVSSHHSTRSTTQGCITLPFSSRNLASARPRPASSSPFPPRSGLLRPWQGPCHAA
eukprot:3570117-Rhodomonas_salina.4